MNIFKNKKILITGHTGFKGGWLTSLLCKYEAKLYGISLDPLTKPSLFQAAKIQDLVSDNRINITNRESLSKKIHEIKPDFIFHLAAQALVNKSYDQPCETYETNIIGTLNILETLRNLNNKCTVILVTSDKSYANHEWVWGYKESDELGGDDPYSGSKSATELVVKSFIKSFFPSSGNVKVGIARAGNVIGGGDWSENRIVPDCIKAWSNNKKAILRNPNATRPWQHALEPLSGYLSLAINLYQSSELHGQAFNFGPISSQNKTVYDLVENLSIEWGNGSFKFAEKEKNKMKEAGLLKLNCDKALHLLDWKPTLNFDETVKFTASWYKEFYNINQNTKTKTEFQIKEFIKLAKLRGNLWAKYF